MTKIKPVMIKTFILFSLVLASSCSNDKSDDIIKPKEKEKAPDRIEEILNSLKFPTSTDPKISYIENDAIELNKNPAANTRKLVEDIPPGHALFLVPEEVTTAQLEEIKKATNRIVQGATTQEQKYRKIFNWLGADIKYETSDNNAYAVYKNRKAVCQGYANLLKLMCYTQNIPAFVAGGYLYANGSRIGGHAWNYVNIDGSWWVSDPTNKNDYKMEHLSRYEYQLEPHVLYIDLYENNDFIIGYKDARLSLIEVKAQAPERFFVPFSYNGYKLSSFDPSKLIPANVKEVILNKNITSIGNIEERISGLVNSHNGRNLNAIYIVEDNPVFKSVGHVIFKKSDKSMIFALERAEEIVLQTGKRFGKNIILGLENLKKLTFPSTAQTIESYAVEKCPNLIEVIIPKGCKYESDSFYQCHTNLKIIEKE